MVANRTSTLQFHQTLLGNFSRVQGDLVKLQRQISSGRIADTFQELNGKVEKVSSYEFKLSVTTQYVESNTQAIARLETMNGAVGSVISVTNELQSLITQARGATQAQYPIFAQAAMSKLDQIAGFLNTNIGGRYLFAGTKTNVPPVMSPVPNNVNLGVPDTNYYQGNTTDQSVRAQENIEVSYGIRADNIAFQNLVASVHMFVDGLNNNKMVNIEAALELSNAAQEGLNAVQSKINGDSVLLQDINSFHGATDAYVRGIVGEETATDVAKASTEVALNEAILQASFSAFATVNNLRLTNFL